MKLDGRRASTNVDDRRNKGGSTAAKVGGGIGIGGIIIALIMWFFGTSEQRYRWFKKGLESGDPAAGRVLLTMPYDQL